MGEDTDEFIPTSVLQFTEAVPANYAVTQEYPMPRHMWTDYMNQYISQDWHLKAAITQYAEVKEQLKYCNLKTENVSRILQLIHSSH